MGDAHHEVDTLKGRGPILISGEHGVVVVGRHVTEVEISEYSFVKNRGHAVQYCSPEDEEFGKGDEKRSHVHKSDEDSTADILDEVIKKFGSSLIRPCSERRLELLQ